MILEIHPRRTDRGCKNDTPGRQKQPLGQGGGGMGIARMGRMSEEEEQSQIHGEESHKLCMR